MHAAKHAEHDASTHLMLRCDLWVSSVIMATANPTSAILALPSGVSNTLALCRHILLSSSLPVLLHQLERPGPDLHLNVQVKDAHTLKVIQPHCNVPGHQPSPAKPST